MNMKSRCAVEGSVISSCYDIMYEIVNCSTKAGR